MYGLALDCAANGTRLQTMIQIPQRQMIADYNVHCTIHNEGRNLLLIAAIADRTHQLKVSLAASLKFPIGLDSTKQAVMPRTPRRGGVKCRRN